MAYVAETFGPQGFATYLVDWSSGVPSFERVIKHPEVILIPGFVDLHIHGAFGIDLMSASRKEFELLCDKLSEVGYEGFLPTTVTSSIGNIEKFLHQMPEHRMILGFHMEGPFISPAQCGVQPRNWIVPYLPNDTDWDPVLNDPRMRIITLAPEVPGAVDLALRMLKRSVVVSMGHSNATFDQAREGFEFGASQVTHTFNAMRGIHHREPGIAGYALTNDSLSCELIYDRKHVSKEMVGLLLKCKRHDKLIAVSDSTQATGMMPGLTIEMWGMKCSTEKGAVRLEDGTLAGSAVTLYDVFKNLADDFGLEIAIRSCCLNPRSVLKMGEPRLYLELNRSFEITGRREIVT